MALGDLPWWQTVPRVAASPRSPSTPVPNRQERGQPLTHSLDRGDLSPRRSAEITLALADNLAYLHGQQLVHGEVAINKVFLDAEGRPHLRGVPVLATARHSPGDDVAALGAILYELLTGQSVSTPLVPPRILRPELPRDLEATCGKALAAPVGQRYTSCQDFADDLRCFLHDQPPGTGRERLDRRLLRWWRREPWLTSGLLLVTAFFLVFGVGAWRQAAREAHNRVLAEESRNRLQQEHNDAAQSRQGLESAVRKAELAQSIAEQTAQQTFHEKEKLEGLLAAAKQAQLKAGVENTRLDQQLRERREELYEQALLLAQGELEAGHPDMALNWLERCPSQVPRGWEYRYLASAAQEASAEAGWHRLAFRPPAARWLAWAKGKTIVLRRRVANPGPNEIRMLEAPEPVLCLAFSGDGRYLAVGCQGGAVRAWDVTGPVPQVVFRDRHAGKVLALACSSDGQLLATAGVDRAIHLTHVGKDEWKTQVFPDSHATAIRWLSFDPNGRLFTSASLDGHCRLWDSDTGRDSQRPLENVCLNAFHPQGRLHGHALASGNGVVTFHYHQDQALGSLPGRHELRDLVLIRGGHGAVSLDQAGQVTLWEVRTPGPALTQFTCRSVGGFAVSLENELLAWMPDRNTVNIRDLANPSFPTVVWQQDTGKNEPSPPLLSSYQVPIRSLAWDAKGQKLLTVAVVPPTEGGATVASHLRIWGGVSGQLLNETIENRFAVTVAVCSVEGLLAWVGDPGSIDLAKDWGKGEHFVLKEGPKDTVRFLALSPDGATLAAAGSDRRLILWDVSARMPRHSLTDIDVVAGLAFSPDGKHLVAGLSNGMVGQWDVARGVVERTLLMPHKETVHGVVFGPGGEWLLAWSERGTLQSWQTLDGTPLNTLAGPSDGILALAISPDKERLALACRDRTVRLLTYPAGKELLALPTDAFLAPALNFRPDGQELTAATANGVRRWHVSTPP